MNVFTSAFTARSNVVEIGPKKPLSLYLPEGAAIHSVVGRLWITQEGLIDDFVIPAGERFDVRHKGQIVVSAIDETAVVYLAPEGHAGPAVVASTPEVLDALIARAVQLRRQEMTRWVRVAVHYVRQALKRVRKAWRHRPSPNLGVHGLRSRKRFGIG